MPYISDAPVVKPYISDAPKVTPEELQTQEAVKARVETAKSRLDPMSYLRGAVKGVSDFAGQVSGAAKELTSTKMAPFDMNVADPSHPLWSMTAPQRSLGEAVLRGAADLGQLGKDFAESQVLDPYAVVRQAMKEEGIMNTLGKLAENPRSVYIFPGMDRTLALLPVFPKQALEVIQKAHQRDQQQAADREALAKGDRSYLGEAATAATDLVTGGDTQAAETVGKFATPSKALAQTTDLASNFADPGLLTSRLVSVGSRLASRVAPGVAKTMTTPILEMGGKAAKVAEAAKSKEELARIGANNRKAWEEAALRGDPTAPPLQTPPIQIIPPSEAELAKSLFGTKAAEAAQKAPGVVQKAAGVAGQAAEAAGKGVETLAGKVDELADKYETPLSALSTVAGAAKGPIGAVVGSQLPGTIRKAAKWGENASRAGTALRTIANTDWDSSIPVWRQIAKDPNAPKWLVRGVTANVVGKLKAGELLEKTLRTGTDLGKGVIEGAGTDALLTGLDTSKSGEEIGGEAGVGGIFGGASAGLMLKSMSRERKALAFAYDSMRKASESIQAGADPLVVASTPDELMHSSVILEQTFRGMVAGRQDLKVDLMDAAQFAKASKDPNAAAYFDESTGRIAVNLESADAAGRQLHEIGHALMASVAASNPAIIQHFRQALGPDGMARARQDYQQALGRTIPQDDAFIVGELFSEAMANGLRGVNLNEALPVVLGRTATQSFFRDADVRKVLKDPATLDLVRQQFQAASDFRPALDMEKEPGVKLRPEQAGNHPALPTETRADGSQGNDFVDVVNGQTRETPVPVVRARVRNRRKEVLTLFPDVPPSGNANPQASNIGVRQGPSGMTEKTGTRLGEQFYATARSFGEGTKNMLRRVEQAIANNETMAGWYQQIGTGDGWAASVRESLGAMEAQYKDFIPFAFKVDKQGNLLVQNYSLTALDRKASDWAGRSGPLSLELWNGDLNTFKADVQTYLKNHAEGRPGSDGIGEMKRNVINVFLVGGNRTFEALNPLRPQAKGKDRQGIVRSYRADRLQTVEPSDVTGYEKPDYSKQVRNLSPELDKQFWEGDSQQFSPAVRGGQEDFTPPTKTIKAYKLFRTLKTQPGKLFPLFIGKGEPVPVGQWIPAKFIPTKGFAERPGWHAGVLPNAPHLLSKDGTMPSDRVWAEVEIPADVDWQSTADATSTGDIKSEVPSGGYYTFKRPGLQGGSWVIGGALKVNRLLSQADVDKIMSDAGASKAAPVSGQVRNSPQVVPPEQLELNFNKAVNQLGTEEALAPEKPSPAPRAPRQPKDAPTTFSITASRIKRLLKRGPVNPIGMSAATAQDRHAVAALFRNPAFEAMRWVFVKEGKVVAVANTTVRQPDAVHMLTKGLDIDQLSKMAVASGADSLFWTHNHPSGISTPSEPDVRATKSILSWVGFRSSPLATLRFLGHVVTNHTDHHIITSFGSVDRVQVPAPGPDKWLNKPIWDAEIVGPSALARVGAAFANPNNPSRMILFLDPRKYIKAVGEISPNIDSKKFAEEVRKFAIANGASSAVAYGSFESDAVMFEQLVRDGILDDAFIPGFGGLRDAMMRPPRLFETPPREASEDQVVRNAGEKLLFSPGVAQSPEKGFYSKLEQVIGDEMKGASMPAAQLKAVLRNRGVKAEEMKWTKADEVIDQLAAQNGGKVPKEALMQALQKNRVPLRQEVFSSERDDTGYSQYADYTLPGGEDYREVVLAMPEKKLTELPPGYQPKLQKSGTKEGYWVSDKSGFKVGFNHSRLDGLFNTEQEAVAGALESLNRGAVFDRERGSYKSRHFDTSNYVAHMRLKDRVDADGRPGLFIEEVQSDRHQEGRQKGYAQTKEQMQSRLDELLKIPAKDRTPAQQDEITTLSSDINSKTGGQTGVPDAPFRKDWGLQMFKRALREAVANGQGWVGWTTGDTQATRFDLSKRISEIHYSGTNLKAYDLNGKTVIEQTGVSPEQLPEYIGKEAAEKLLAQPAFGTRRSLGGVDLKVGGEGMRGFYDKILPNEVQKYVKQWGGKVEKAELDVAPPDAGAGYKVKSSGEAKTPFWKVSITPEMAQSISTKGQERFSPQITPEQDAAYLDAVQKGDTQAAQRMVDEAAKAAGYTLGPLWHGTGDEFTEFEPGRAGASYFTADKEYARGYGSNLRSFYLRADDKVADLSDPESPQYKELVRAFNEAGGWAADEDLFREMQELDPARKSPRFDPKKDLTWEIFDYPAADAGAELISQGFRVFKLQEREGIDSYAVLDPDRIKLADPITRDDAGNVIPLSQRFDQAKEDIRFSPQVDRNLVALHNTTEEGIRAALKLGGIPVPSLGITKKDTAFTGFGDITLIADKSAIDPQADPRNKVYNADVYSPRQPRPFQAVKRGARDRLSKRMKELLPKGFQTWSDLAPGERAYDMVVEKGENNVLETRRKLAGAPDVQAAFLTQRGIEVPRLMKDPNLRNRSLSREQLADPRLAVLSQHSSDLYDFLQTPEGIAAGDAVRDLAVAGRMSDLEGITEEQKQRLNGLMEKSYGARGTPFPFRYISDIVDDLATVAKNEQEVDRYGIQDWIREQLTPLKAEFEQWVDGLVADTFETDQKLLSGRTKKPYALDTLVEEMSGDPRARERGMTYSLGKARSDSAKALPSLEAVRSERGSLTDSESMRAFKDAQSREFSELSDRLQYFNPEAGAFERLDRLSEAVGKAAKRPATTGALLSAAGFKRVPDSLVKAVRDFATKLATAPTEYFEAKPQRAVTLNEFRAAVVPESTSPEVVDALRQAGLAVETYTDNANRVATVERLSTEKDLLFSPKITPEQDAAYLSAVQKGDTAAAQRMVDEAAVKAGYTVGPVWHGGAKPTVFNVRAGEKTSRHESSALGSFFSDSEETASQYGNTAPYFLRIENPIELSEREQSALDTVAKARLFRMKAKQDGFDGAIIRTQDAPGFKGGTEYVAFDPTQIKSADPITRDDAGNVIPLSQRFDQAKEDIRFSPKVSLDQPSDKVMDTSAINVLHGNSTVLPPGTKEAPRTLDTVAKNLQEAAIAQWGRIINSYDITPDEYRVIRDNAVAECVAALRASGKNAFDWYTKAVERAVTVMSVVHPEIRDDSAAKATGVFPNAEAAKLGMMMAMAITSQNLSVEFNSRFAEEQFTSLMTHGKFDPAREYGEKALSISSNLKLANTMIEKIGWEGTRNFLAQSFTVKELADVASKVAGHKVAIAGRVNDVVQGAAIFGPKIGQGFLQNLYGNYVPVTIDLWMRRTWGRWTGDVMEADPLTPQRVARLLDAVREKGYRLPDKLKTLRTVVRRRKSGAEYTTLSETLVEQVRSNPELRDAFFAVCSELSSEWQSRYRSIKAFPVRPADAQALKDGTLTADQLSNRQLALLERLEQQYKDLEVGPLEVKPSKAEWRNAKLAELGRTERLSNETLAAVKPDWAKAAIVIENALGPIDVPNDQDREVITRLVNDVRNLLKQQGIETTNADIQAILWYPEKDLWAKLSDGTLDSDLKQSYDTEFLKIAEARGLGEKARAALQQADRAARTGEGAGAEEAR